MCGPRYLCTETDFDIYQCDSQKPTCGNCLRRLEICEFVSAPQPTLLGASRISTPMSNDSFKTELDQSSLGLDLQSLELLHHFSTVVCFTLSKEPQMQEMWQIQVPKEAIS